MCSITPSHLGGFRAATICEEKRKKRGEGWGVGKGKKKGPTEKIGYDPGTKTFRSFAVLPTEPSTGQEKKKNICWERKNKRVWGKKKEKKKLLPIIKDRRVRSRWG